MGWPEKEMCNITWFFEWCEGCTTEERQVLRYFATNFFAGSFYNSCSSFTSSINISTSINERSSETCNER